MIKFGTDGWRAVLGEEFHDINVEKVSLAIGKYVYDHYGYDKQILIGYDPRKRADFYARLCADILSQKGFVISLSSNIVPTPVLAFNAQFRNACAIMFTASHNPPEYLGMKFIPDYAGPATSEITDEIMGNIDKDFPSSESSLDVNMADFGTAYFASMNKLIDFDKIRTLKSKILFDGLYSASIGYFDEILKSNGIEFDSIHMEHDPNFGGLMPDPKPAYLKALVSRVCSEQGTIGLANDGDADRFGVIDENGYYVAPDVVIAILLKYLIKKGFKGSLVKTVGSSILLDETAKKLNIPVIETPVGFKYVGEAMRNHEVIIGGEESGGLSIQGHIPEKDGILANLLLLEAVADSGKSLYDLVQETYEFVGCRFYAERHDFKKSGSEVIDKALEIFGALKIIGEYEITDIDKKDGVKLMLDSRTKILVRPSGTEPLLRVYFETDKKDKLEHIEELTDELVNSIH